MLIVCGPQRPADEQFRSRQDYADAKANHDDVRCSHLRRKGRFWLQIYLINIDLILPEICQKSWLLLPDFVYFGGSGICHVSVFIVL